MRQLQRPDSAAAAPEPTPGAQTYGDAARQRCWKHKPRLRIDRVLNPARVVDDVAAMRQLSPTVGH